MSKKRMAGEELDKGNPVAKAAKDSVSNAAAQQKVKRPFEERAGEEYIDRTAVGGIQDANDEGQYRKKELMAEALRAGYEGDDFANAYQGLVDSGTGFNQRAKRYLKKRGVDFSNYSGGGSKPPEEEEGGTGGGNGGGGTGGGGTDTNIEIGNSQTVNQDNDIKSNVKGDGNIVNIGQDNSVNQKQGAYKYQSKGGVFSASNLMDNYVLNLRQSKANS